MAPMTNTTSSQLPNKRWPEWRMPWLRPSRPQWRSTSSKCFAFPPLSCSTGVTRGDRLCWWCIGLCVLEFDYSRKDLEQSVPAKAKRWTLILILYYKESTFILLIPFKWCISFSKCIFLIEFMLLFSVDLLHFIWEYYRWCTFILRWPSCLPWLPGWSRQWSLYYTLFFL